MDTATTILLTKSLEVPHESRNKEGTLKPLPRPTMGSISIHRPANLELHTCQTFCDRCNPNDMNTCLEKCKKEENTNHWSCKLFR